VTKDTETTRPANDGSHELASPKVETPNKVEERTKTEDKQKSEETNPKPVESAVTAGTEVKEDSKKTSEKDQVKADTEIKPSSEKSQALSGESNKAEVEKEKQLLSDRKQDFNKDWYFKLNAQGDFSKKDVDVHDWSKLNLPHDWSIYFDFDHKSPARNEGGIFRDLFDLCARVDLKKINRRTFESLIMSGAFDKLGPHRAALSKNLEDALKASDQHAKDEAMGQADMFGVLTETHEEVENAYAHTPPYTEKQILDGERETLGLYLSSHLVSRYLKELSHYSSTRLKDLTPNRRGQISTAAGLLVSTRFATTKKGNRIGIATIDDRSGRLDLTLFGESLDQFGEKLQKDTVVVVSGQVSFDDFSGGLKMSVRDLMTLDEARSRYAKSLAISLSEEQISLSFIKKLKEMLEPVSGGTLPINVYYQSAKGRALLRLGIQWSITPTDDILTELVNLLGENAVELEFG